MKRKQIDLIRQIIAILTIIGCLYSFLIGIWTFGTNFTQYSLINKIIFVFFFCLYLFGIKISIHLYNNNSKYLFLFEIFTLLQVFSIQSSVISYKFSTALNFLIHFKINQADDFIIGTKFNFFNFFSWNFMSDINTFYCSINLVSIIILVFINIYLTPKKRSE